MLQSARRSASRTVPCHLPAQIQVARHVPAYKKERRLTGSVPRIAAETQRHPGSPDFLQALCEIALNHLKGNIPFSASQYQKCQKKIIRLLADKKTSLNHKCQVFEETDGRISLSSAVRGHAHSRKPAGRNISEMLRCLKKCFLIPLAS